MAKKQFFAILDTETTVADTIADFAIIIVDRQGIVHNTCAVLIKDQFDKHELFYDKNAKGLWSLEYAKEKRIKYNDMLNAGSRTLASINAVNRWIAQAIGKYNPTLTAYNLAFDVSKCRNTDIDLTGFKDCFCLWQAAVGNICNTKPFKQFALENHAFNNVTDKGNMTFKTNAEIVAGFLSGSFVEEPHTALEDAQFFELPILKHILTKKNWKEKIIPYDWNKFQVKNHFTVK